MSSKGILEGIVVQLIGDYMPFCSRVPDPYETNLYIFEGKLKEELTRQNSNLLKQKAKVIRSDKKGYYRTKLNPGIYTVLLDIDGILWSEIRDADNNMGNIEVKAGEKVWYPIRETTKSHC